MFNIHITDAFHDTGCPICRLRRRAVARYIFHTLWENVGDITFRQRFLAADGLCPEHAWQFQTTEAEHWHDGLGTANLYESLLAAVRQQLAHALATDRPQSLPWWHPSRWWPLPARRAPSSPAAPEPGACPVCHVGRFEETFYARELAGKLVETAWQSAYAASDGLCLHHLRLTYNQSAPETRRWLLAETDARLQTLQRDLAEYIRKHSWQFRDEPVSEAEGQSWIRAVAWLRGEKPDEG
jgi:hypothetical protein